MEHLSAMKDSMKKFIEDNNPERIVLPSPYPDHADHLAVYIAGMNAVLELKNEEYFKEKPIEILACEPEFGVTKGRKVVLDKIPTQFGGYKEVTNESLNGIVYPRYRFELSEAGKVTPAANITEQGVDRKTHSLDKHTIAAPPYIVKLSDDMVTEKITALEKHQTQVNGTRYEEPIMLLDHLRGTEVKADWGIGIYPIKIPDVTREDSPFLDNLDPASVFQLEKRRYIAKEHGDRKR